MNCTSLRTGLAATAAVFTLSASSTAWAETFSGPTIPLAAGLDTDGAQTGRVGAEASYHTQSDSTFGSTVHVLAFQMGGAFKVTDFLEIEASLPIAGYVQDSDFVSGDQFGVGNLSIGANVFGQANDLLWKVGGGFSFGPWNDLSDPETLAVSAGTLFTRAYQETWMWQQPAVHLFVPARVEYGQAVRFTGDASLDLSIPTDSLLDPELFAVLAPGIAFRPIDLVNVGGRLPVQLLPTNDPDDMAQLSLEPYVQLNFGSAYLASRLTVNLDDDLGFSFDSGGFWGLHLGAGGTF